MATNVYTLNELVDLALRTPDIGAVNFNILRIVLQKIISECELQNKTAEWKPFKESHIIERDLETKREIQKQVVEIQKQKDISDHPVTDEIFFPDLSLDLKEREKSSDSSSDLRVKEQFPHYSHTETKRKVTKQREENSTMDDRRKPPVTESSTSETDISLASGISLNTLNTIIIC